MIPSSELSLQPSFIPLTLDQNLFVFKFLQLLMIQLYSFCQLVQREPWSKCVLVIPFILSSSFLLWSFLIVLFSWFLTPRFCIITWVFCSDTGALVPPRLTFFLKPSKKRQGAFLQMLGASLFFSLYGGVNKWSDTFIWTSCALWTRWKSGGWQVTDPVKLLAPDPKVQSERHCGEAGASLGALSTPVRSFSSKEGRWGSPGRATGLVLWETKLM